jgi:flagellar hook-basal body complex protein FliE
MKIDFASSPSPFVMPAVPSSTAASSSADAGAGFVAAFGAAVSQVEAARSSATNAANELLANGKGDVHSVALAAQRADLALEMFQQVRNKFVQAYQEIMKMPM